jgi:hypothetical protein
MTYEHCQSCGMPFDRDPRGGGSNADGSKSTLYCSHCWRDGAFTLPDLTVEQMSERVRGKLIEAGLSEGVATEMSNRVPTLRRWSA